MTAHNTQKIQTSLTAAGFKQAIPASERLKTYAVYSAATAVSDVWYGHMNFTVAVCLMTKQNVCRNMLSSQ
jgi:hypothetical protein